jgi:hypothetical protein
VSHADPDEFEELMLLFPCLKCGVPAGQWCETRSGRLAIPCHADRYHQAYALRARRRMGRV